MENDGDGIDPARPTMFTCFADGTPLDGIDPARPTMFTCFADGTPFEKEF